MKAQEFQEAAGCTDEVLSTAHNCRHYAMCKVDFLGNGVCASGPQRGFVAFYPQGHMDLYAALRDGGAPVTSGALAVADSCDLCGKCDHQCYFVTELRPTRVMRALKEHLAAYLQAGGRVESEAEDPVLARIREIVGDQWATNDRAIAVTYSHDPSPIAVPKLPAYVVLPGSAEEVASLLRLFKETGIPWTARGNGSNILGFELGEGAIIDLNRMREMSFDEKNWSVRVGPGVSAFELQSAAVARGFRVHVAEPAALVLASIMCSGILSLFATSYGTSAEGVLDARFVAPDGSTFSMNQKQGPNLFAFAPAPQTTPGICVSADLKLHPKTDDEEGALIPCSTLAAGLELSRELAQRRIGFAVGVLGIEYVASFMAPTQELANQAKQVFGERLGMACLVLVLGDRYAMGSLKQMGHPLIDQRLFRTLNLGLPHLASAPWLDLLTQLALDEPFGYLKAEGFAELAETALAPSPQRLARAVHPELREFHEKLYARPELTDLVWLNMFRITSSRIGREKHFFPILLYLPLEAGLIEELCARFQAIAQSRGIKHEVGFLAPIDSGKRCIFEYDYYVDQCDAGEIERVREAVGAVAAVIDEVGARTGTLRWMRYVLYQGFCRMENLLYTEVPRG
ncbi:hypothetical protein GMLC_03770 [Geomonas limicola]|uniref:FAD-binding PCMH-type domain-containing protein n=1 Tax=Geomonas limicola TaxID=2740186 RepID=A0A6V8N2N4_9BACT|nr:FAD-dependent oxidoreductase [Geomonas limicola]GFO66798.1 hypothetical protein GMLC_03770 [Geomonas limicola]